MRSHGDQPARQSAEHHCLRVVQLLSEGVPLSEAFAQAEIEKSAQERFDAASLKRQLNESQARKLAIDWPDFEMDDIRRALDEADRDEDLAISLLHSGGARHERLGAEPRPVQCEEVVEEFPVIAGSRTATVASQVAPCRGSWYRPVRCQLAAEAFPRLPQSCSRPATGSRFAPRARR